MTALAEAVPLRRGACPGLSAPMATGDGLLVRLQPIGTVPLAAFDALCAASRRHGNGVIEITSRGNIQVRGLSAASAPRFAAAIATLDIAADDGVPVLCNPLTGLDPDERVDAATLAEELRGALARSTIAARLGAKTSIVIESGGALDPADVPADIRVFATAAGAEIAFDLAVGGDRAGATPLGTVARRDAIEAVIRLLEVMATHGRHRRFREIVSTEGEAPCRTVLTDIVFAARPGGKRPRGDQREVIGTHPLRDGSVACGVGLAFGHSDATTLEQLTEVADAAGASGFRAAAGRALLAIGMPPFNVSTFTTTAEKLGFVTRADDPRRRVIACAGAPICASAHIAARAMAPDIAATVASFLDGARTIHVSGCAKGCAHSAPAALTVVGTPGGCALVANGAARDAPFTVVAEPDLPAAVERFTRARTHEDGHVRAHV